MRAIAIGGGLVAVAALLQLRGQLGLVFVESAPLAIRLGFAGRAAALAVVAVVALRAARYPGRVGHVSGWVAAVAGVLGGAVPIGAMLGQVAALSGELPRVLGPMAHIATLTVAGVALGRCASWLWLIDEEVGPARWLLVPAAVAVGALLLEARLTLDMLDRFDAQLAGAPGPGAPLVQTAMISLSATAPALGQPYLAGLRVLGAALLIMAAIEAVPRHRRWLGASYCATWALFLGDSVARSLALVSGDQVPGLFAGAVGTGEQVAFGALLVCLARASPDPEA